MDFERLRQVDQLFSYRWDAFIVASLSDRPLRFTALAYRVSMHALVKVPDSSIARGIERLTRAGVIVADGEDGHHLYALTPKGEATATILAAVTAAVSECLEAAHPARRQPAASKPPAHETLL